MNELSLLRSYKLMIGKKGQKDAIVIEPPMRIKFDIEKDCEAEPNENTIKIYNLASTTRKTIEQPDMRCVLYAGYEQEGNVLLCSGILPRRILIIKAQIG